MNKEKIKPVLGVIAILLWAIIIIVAVRSYIKQIENSLPIFRIIFIVCIVLFFIWWLYKSIRFQRFMKCFDEAGFRYLVTQDTEAYLKELDECSKIPGVEKFTLSNIPAKQYIVLLKIINLRYVGRVEEAYTLLEMIEKDIVNDKARQLWEAEKKRLQ